jgi:hypothetical protein
LQDYFYAVERKFTSRSGLFAVLATFDIFCMLPYVLLRKASWKKRKETNHFNLGSVKTGPFFMHPMYVCGCGRSLAKSKESLSAEKNLLMEVLAEKQMCVKAIKRIYLGFCYLLLRTWSQVNVIISFNIEIRIEQRIGSLKVS